MAEVGDWENNRVLTAANFRSAAQIASAARKCPPDYWAGFQLYYPMPEDEQHLEDAGPRGQGSIRVTRSRRNSLARAGEIGRTRR